MARHSNFTLFVIQGIFGAGSLSLVPIETVVPGLFQLLRAPVWMISLTPVLALVSCAVTAPFAPRIIDRLPRKLGFMLYWCVPLQRGAVFLMPLLLMSVTSDRAMAYLLFIGLLLPGIGNGLAIPAWNRILAKTVAAPLLPRLLSLQMGGAALIGVGGGFAVKWVLERWPGRTGFAVLYFFSALLAVGAIYYFCLLREPRESERRLAELRRNPVSAAELFRNHDMRNYMLTRGFFSAVYLAMGMLPLHCCRQLGLGEAYLGIFAALVVAGALAGNLFTTLWTRKRPPRDALIVSLVLYAAVFVLGAFPVGRGAALTAFFLLGFARDTWNSVGASLMVTLPDRRMLGMASSVTTLVMAPSVLLAGVLGGVLIEAVGYRPVALLAAALLLPAVWFAARLPRTSGGRRTSIRLNNGRQIG